jgi:hypothetical protein
MKWITMLRKGLLLGSVAATAACGEPATQTGTLECSEYPPYDRQDINGQGGTNGLDSDAFHKYWEEFQSMTKIPLSLDPVTGSIGGKYALNPAIVDGFLRDGDDYEIRSIVFDKVIQCALPRPTTDPTHPGVSLEDSKRNRLYKGGGLLGTATQWVTNGLGQSAMEDVVTCVILLLNPHYKGIPVFIAGSSVSTADPITAGDYPFEEALWTVTINEVDFLRFHVWPLFEGPQIKSPKDCSHDEMTPENPWKYRVCGFNDQNCGVDVRYGRFEKECELDPLAEGSEKEHYLCGLPDGSGVLGSTKPAIKTRLKTACDLNALFCPPKPQ